MLHHLRPVFLSCAALVLAHAAPRADAQAPDKPRTGTLGAGKGKGKAQGPLLTRAELRECLNLQVRLRSSTEDVVAAQAALDKEKTEVAQRGAALKEELAALDRTSAPAVDAYNESVREHEKRVDAYNAKTPVFNAQVGAMQEQRAAFSKGCENRDFDEKDEIAIRKGQ